MSYKKHVLVKFFIWFFSALIFIMLLFNMIFYYVLHSKIPVVLAKNDLDYHISYADLSVSFFSREVVLDKISIHPIDTTAINKSGIYAQIDKIKLYDVSLFHVISSDEIQIGGLTIESPIMRLYPLKKDSLKIKKQFDKILKLDVFDINNGFTKIYRDHESHPFFYLNNYSFKLKGIGITPEGLHDKIPFTFSDYNLSADSFQFIMNKFYTITTGKLNSDFSTINLNDIKLQPNFSKTAFLKHVKHQVDVYNISVQSIKFDSVKWGYNSSKELFVDISSANFNKINAHIYRDKSLPPDTRFKPLYSKMLRDIPFFLNIKNVDIKNSNIVYDEEQDLRPLYGTVNFSDFNASIKNVSSGFKQNNLPDVSINVNCKFYDIAPLSATWSFNVLNLDDDFKISGTLKNLPANRVNKFIQPSFNVTTQGDFKELQFDYTGNNNFAKGKFAIDYSGLQVTVLKKDGHKNHFLSFLGDILVEKNTDDQFKRVHVKFDRIKDKSFFNLVWKTTAKGLEHTLLII